MTDTMSSAAGVPAPTRARIGNDRSRRERRAGWLFLLPDAVGLIVFLGIPMALTFVLSFFRVNGFGEYTFVGLANFQRMFSDPQFTSSLVRSLVYVVVLVPVLFAVSLGLALLVTRKIPMIGVFRSAFFVPYVVSLVVVGLVWQFMLADKVGVVSRAFSGIGVDTSWLGDPKVALLAVIVVTVWYQMGYYMIIFMAGIQDIPKEYLEAARMDGAGAWSTFRSITWPLLRPTSFFVLLTSTIAALTGGLDLIYILTKGGPANSTTLVIFYIFQQAFQYGEFGYAAAMSTFLVLVMLLISLLIFKVTRGGRFDND